MAMKVPKLTDPWSAPAVPSAASADVLDEWSFEDLPELPPIPPTPEPYSLPAEPVEETENVFLTSTLPPGPMAGSGSTAPLGLSLASQGGGVSSRWLRGG